MKYIFFSCFFFSGAASLIYQICWIRKAALIFGSTTFAVSAVIAVFFLGLAIGSYWFGKLNKHNFQPLKCYAIIEIVLAILAIFSLTTFDASQAIYQFFIQYFGEGSIWQSNIFKIF